MSWTVNTKEKRSKENEESSVFCGMNSSECNIYEYFYANLFPVTCCSTFGNSKEKKKVKLIRFFFFKETGGLTSLAIAERRLCTCLHCQAPVGFGDLV